MYPHEHVAIVASFAKKKEQYLEDNLAVLRKLSDTIVITEFSGEQDYINESIEADIMITAAKHAQFTTVSFAHKPQEAVNAALKTAPIVVVTGSFYLLSHIRSVHVL
jgi:folylpolyglutamate synthase/dihydropteroate synthase